MFRNPGKHLSIHLVNFYNSPLSGRKHSELLPAKGKGSVLLRASSPFRLFFVVVYSVFGVWARAGLCFPEGMWHTGRAPGPGRGVGAARGRHARSRSPRRPLPFCILWHSACLCAQVYSWWIRFPPQSHVPGARQSEQINYFQLQACAWGRKGGRGAGGGPSAPQPDGAQPPPEYERGMTLGLSDPF